MKRIGFIGFGEVGSNFADGFPPSTTRKAAFDEDPGRIQDIAEKKDVSLLNTLEELTGWADLIFSCNSPAVAVDVAGRSALFMRADAVFIDCNNISPKTTAIISNIFTKQKRQFVKAALMTPIAASGFRVSMLIGGHKARDVCSFLQSFRFQVRAVGDSSQKPAIVKMVKSLWGKGLSTLLIELYAFAKASGVESEVDYFLEDMFGKTFWTVADKYMSSVAVHAERMIPEMEELMEEMAVRKTVCEFPKAIRAVLAKLADIDLRCRHDIDTSSSHRDIVRHLDFSDDD